MNDIVRRLYQTFDPVRPLQPEDKDLYVELDEVRGSVGVVERLAENIRLSDRPTCQLLTGHRGSGKSTELGLLKHRLESGDPKYFVMLTQAASHLVVEDIDFPDLLLAIVAQLSDDLKKRRNISLKPKGLAGIVDRISDLVGNTVQLTGLEIGPAFLKLSATMKDSPSARQIIRQALDPVTNDLIAAANDVIGLAALRLNKMGYAGLVIIIDDLDKMPAYPGPGAEVPRAETLFIGRQPQLAEFNCHVVYTLPLDLAYSKHATILDGLYRRPVPLIPMTKIRTEKPPSKLPHKPGVDRFLEIIANRLQRAEAAEGKVFESENVQQELIRLSGGEPSQLMILMREALVGGELPISPAAVERAAWNFRRSYVRFLRAEHWPVIRAVRDSGQFSRSADNDAVIRDLLASRAILQYRNNVEWYALHPLIEDLKAPA